jgi:hypothetical protein
MKMTIRQAVAKASKVSKREGKWANKPEISKKITGHKPDSLVKTLKEEVKKGSIEKKPNTALWRPSKAGGGGKGSSSRGTGRSTRTGRTTERTTRRTTGRTDRTTRRTPTTRRSDRRTTVGEAGRGLRDVAVTTAILGSVGGVTRP